MGLCLTDEALFKLAVDEYRDQDRVRETLFSRMRSLIALATVVLTASGAIFDPNPETQSIAPSYIDVSLGVNWISAACVWVLVLISLGVIVWTQGPTDYADVPAFEEMLDWRAARIEQLKKSGYSEDEAAEIARGEVSAKLMVNYAACESVNRQQNDSRQRWLSTATRFLIIAVIVLLVQAGSYLILVPSR